MSKPDPAVFHGAHQRIRSGGLAKGKFSTARGEYCTLGACGYPSGLVEVEVRLLAEMIGIQPVPCTCGCGLVYASPDVVVARWNDAPERTAEDVLTLLEQAAEKAEADR